MRFWAADWLHFPRREEAFFRHYFHQTAGFSIIALLSLLLLAASLREAELLFARLYGIRDKKDMILLVMVKVLTNPAVVFAYYAAAQIRGVGNRMEVNMRINWQA